MTSQTRRRSRSVLLSSLVSVLFVIIAYSYYNYQFSKLRYIDFNEIVFYTGDSDIFVPTKENYLVVFYSSLQYSSDEVLSMLKNPKKTDVLLVDFAQNRKPSHENVIYLTTGINNILKVVKIFRVEHSPSALVIEQIKNTKYKQATLIERIDR